MIFVCFWVIRLRRSLNNGRTASTSGTSVERTQRTGPTFQEFSRVATNGSGVVGKIATTARMTCFYLLVVGATSCLDWVVHAFLVADALPTSCPCDAFFRVDLRDSVEQRVRRKCLMTRGDLVQLGGQVPNPQDPYTAVRRRGCKTRHVQHNRLATVSDRTKWLARLQDKKSQSLLAYVADLARDRHRRGGGVFLAFLWNWNAWTTCPIQSVLNEALFSCRKERNPDEFC